MAEDLKREMYALRVVMESPDGPEALKELFSHASHSGSTSYLKMASEIANKFLKDELGDAFIELTVQPNG